MPLTGPSLEMNDKKSMLTVSILFLGTQILVGGGISEDGFDPAVQVISLSQGSNQDWQVDPIPPSVGDIHAAGIVKEQPVVCGKVLQNTQIIIFNLSSGD